MGQVCKACKVIPLSNSVTRFFYYILQRGTSQHERVCHIGNKPERFAIKKYENNLSVVKIQSISQFISMTPPSRINRMELILEILIYVYS